MNGVMGGLCTSCEPRFGPDDGKWHQNKWCHKAVHTGLSKCS